MRRRSRRWLVLGAVLAALIPWGVSAARATASAPPAPVNLQAAAMSNGRVELSWTPGAGVTSNDFLIRAYLGTTFVSQEFVAGDDTTVTGLKIGQTYTFTVAGGNAVGQGAAAATTVKTVGAVAPAVPTNVTATLSATDNEVTVHWTPAVTAPLPDYYQITVFQGMTQAATQVGGFNCYVGCTGATFDATPATVTKVTVAAANPVGRSAVVTSNSVTVPQRCPVACVAVDATAPGATEAHPGSGFLHGLGPKTSVAVDEAAGAKFWRVSGGSPYTEQSRAGAVPGSVITEILSDDWAATHREPVSLGAQSGHAIPPWTALSTYQAWMTQEVKTLEAAGRADGFTITYWDIQNEPFGGGYYSTGANPAASAGTGGVGETITDFEEQYLAAYNGIRAADPSAKIVAPALGEWAGSPQEAAAEQTGSMDMRTFLDFAVLYNAPPSAIAFHDNSYSPDPEEFAANNNPVQPQSITSEVNSLRALIAARPSLGNPPILLNEYGDGVLSAYPGWTTGRLAAIEQSGVAEANKSCFGTCADGYLDGLLTGNGTTAYPDAWIYAWYAQMTGRQLPVVSNYTGVSGLATLPANGTIEMLIGRHQSCVKYSNSACPSPAAAASSISLRVPSGSSATIGMALVPEQTTALASPIYEPSVQAPVTNGTVTFNTPAMHDGDAVEIIVTTH